MPPAAAPSASSRYTEAVASPVEVAARSARSLLPVANRAPDTTQNRLSVASEPSSIGPGPRLSPGTVSRTARLARTARMATGSATATSASRPAIRRRGWSVRAATRPAMPLPAAVQKSQLPSISPSEISLPQKTTISSRISTI